MRKSTRVEVWWWIFVRNAVKCGEKKNNFHRVFFTSFCGEWGESRWIFFSPRSQYSYKKNPTSHGFEPLTSCMPSSVYSIAPTVAYFDDISWEFIPDWVNIGKQMRWIFERNAVNFCMKCGEMRCNIYFHRIHHNHRISYKNSPRSPHFLQKFTQNPRPGEAKVPKNHIY